MASRSPPLVICGPSGVGKGTLISKLMSTFPGKFGLSVSHTTRKQRPGEEDGKHYNFSTFADMKELLRQEEFVEFAEVHGNMYGTSKSAVEAVQKADQIVVLDIDVQGAKKIKEQACFPGAKFVFVLPPSMEELERRLRGRGTETEDKIQQRLANAQGEITQSKNVAFFDYELTLEGKRGWHEEGGIVPGGVKDFLLVLNQWYPSLVSVSAIPPLIICGPSGVGKGTVISKLQDRFPAMIGLSVSHTTRKPRPGEEDAKHYHFSTFADMKELLKDDKFVEFAEVHGNMYGTSAAAVETVQKAGQLAVLDIDVQGAKKIKEKGCFPGAKFIFILPPSMEELERRLRGRGTETEEIIQRRLANAQGEITFSEHVTFFDYKLVLRGQHGWHREGGIVPNEVEDFLQTLQQWYPFLREPPQKKART